MDVKSEGRSTCPKPHVRSSVNTTGSGQGYFPEKRSIFIFSFFFSHRSFANRVPPIRIRKSVGDSSATDKGAAESDVVSSRNHIVYRLPRRLKSIRLFFFILFRYTFSATSLIPSVVVIPHAHTLPRPSGETEQKLCETTTYPTISS